MRRTNMSFNISDKKINKDKFRQLRKQYEIEQEKKNKHNSATKRKEKENV